MSFLDIFKNLSVDEKILTVKNFNELATSKDYFRTYLFSVYFVGGESSSEPFYWISNTATPVMTTTDQRVDYLHTQIKQAGRTLPQQWQVTVRDNSTGEAFKYFHAWRLSIWPKITKPSVDRYKRVAVVKLIPPTGSSLYRAYVLYGVWPMEIQATTLSYDDDNIATFGVTLAMDYFEVKGVGEAE
jgi:hypothetical protein